jgi:hypothetical protein
MMFAGARRRLVDVDETLRPFSRPPAVACSQLWSGANAQTKEHTNFIFKSIPHFHIV